MIVDDSPPRVHFKNRFRLMNAVIAVVAAALLIFGGIKAIHSDHIFVHDSEAIQTHGVPTIGKVVFASFDSSDEPGGGWTSLRIRFTDEAGRSVVAATGHFGQSGERIGRPIKIIYDSKNPGLIEDANNRQYVGTPSNDEATVGVVLIVAGPIVSASFVFLVVGRVKTAPPGWYMDPWDKCKRRYWSGSVWTGYASPGATGETFVVSGPQTP
jgi:hypothetical protein